MTLMSTNGRRLTTIVLIAQTGRRANLIVANRTRITHSRFWRLSRVHIPSTAVPTVKSIHVDSHYVMEFLLNRIIQ